MVESLGEHVSRCWHESKTQLLYSPRAELSIAYSTSKCTEHNSLSTDVE